MNLRTDPLRRRRRVNSALWAAWADALGFVSELADGNMLSRRLAGRDLVQPLSWTRRVGGKFGVDVELPAGTYSDDTQLRLSVCRCIRRTGFDVEAFAKVELPVWQAYALGGGRASKAAALNIVSPSVPWFANFFKGWYEAGGNGVAMRVQPHVWASQNPLEMDFVSDLITDAITTHGHPRSIVGAVFHASALAVSLETGQVPGLDDWDQLIKLTNEAVDAIESRVEVTDVWLKSWSAASGLTWREAWRTTVGELEGLLGDAASFVRNSLAQPPNLDTYYQLAQRTGGLSRESRGSGTVTSVLALALASARNADPLELLRLSAHATDTDTDTVATMAGSLLGAVTDQAPPSDVLDMRYIVAEAERLADLSTGSDASPGFAYPDLLRWSPPKTQSDAIGLVEGVPAIAGLGRFVAPLKRVGSRQNSAWSWGVTAFGQTLLVKHRTELPMLKDSQLPAAPRVPGSEMDGATKGRSLIAQAENQPTEPGLGQRTSSDSSPATGTEVGEGRPREIDLDSILQWLAEREFSDAAVGYAIRYVSEFGNLSQMATLAASLREHLRRGRTPARGSVEPDTPLGEERMRTALAQWQRVEMLLRETLASSPKIAATREVIAASPIERLLDEAARVGALPAFLLRQIDSLWRDRSRMVHAHHSPPVSYERRCRQVLGALAAARRQGGDRDGGGGDVLF